MSTIGNGTSAATSGRTHQFSSNRQIFLEVYQYRWHSIFLVKDFCTFGGYVVEG